MANSSTNRPHKRVNGSCPYCDVTATTGFDTIQNTDRNHMQVQIHNICEKYSQININTGVRYPLQDPLDQNSSAYI